MANYMTITPFAAFEADHPKYPTPIASAFAALLPALARHIEAEREIEHADIWDTAFRDWLTDAERVFTEVTTHLFTISTTELTCADDRPLQRMAMLIDAMIISENPDAFMRLYGLLPQYESLFCCRGEDHATRHRNAMLGTARRHIDTMATLLTYDWKVEADAGETIHAIQI